MGGHLFATSMHERPLGYDKHPGPIHPVTRPPSSNTSEATLLITIDLLSLPEEYLPYLSSFEVGSQNQATFNVVSLKPTLPSMWKAALSSCREILPDSIPTLGSLPHLLHEPVCPLHMLSLPSTP